MFTASVRVTINRTDKITEAIRRNTKLAVKKTIFDAEAEAKRLAAVDTGAMEASIYSVVGGESHYSKSVSESTRMNEGVPLFPEVKNPDPYGGVLVCGAEYGWYVEHGTERAPAQPFMTPAAELVREPFKQAMSRILDRQL
jgi:HK97 gp10 family phage protein